MVQKKIIQDQPKPGDTSQYNFSDNETDFSYNNSTGLPNNNDKFQNKDLYTKSIGSDVNNAIIERNLKSEETSLIKINKIYIENTNVGDGVHGNSVRCYMFSQQYGGNLDDMSYDEIHSVISRDITPPADSDAADRFFKDNPSNKSEGSDIGIIINDEIIIQNLKSDNIEIEDFPNNTEEYDANLMFQLREQDTEIIDNLNTSIIDETVYNPIYIVVWMKGNRDENIGGDSPRRKKYQVFKINNLDLFDFDDAGNAFGKSNTFTQDDILNREVQEDLPGRDKSAWRVRDFNITINTSRGAQNEFSDADAYSQYFKSVQQSRNVPPNKLAKDGILNLSPTMQLNNGNPPGRNYTDLFPDYFPQTTINILNENNEMQAEDLQSYYEDNELLSIKASAPATIAIELNPIDLEDEESVSINYFYFVINWNDVNNEIKTLNDWGEIRPTDEFELLELQNENLYKLKTNIESVDDYTIEFTRTWDIQQIQNTIPDDERALIYYAGPGFVKDDEQVTLEGTNNNDGTYNVSELGAGKFFTVVGELLPQDEPGGILLQEGGTQTFNSNANFDNTIPMNTYTTPGIKTIKMVMFSYDASSNQVGRWKLITSRFYLDIPINQYPDFAEVGGSDYTTIPYPFTTAVIGGVDDNSKYKKSVQEALSSGKIGDTDIIDEKFLINDLENDELGKSINEMDLEQVRYFNSGLYDMNTLLNIPITTFNQDTETLLFENLFQEENFGSNNDGFNWNLYVNENDSAAPPRHQMIEYPSEEPLGTVKLNIEHSGNSKGDIQIYSNQIVTEVIQGNFYTITFEAKASLDRKAYVTVLAAYPNYERLGLEENFDISTEYTEFSFTFQATATEVNASARLFLGSFQSGTDGEFNNSTVSIKDFSMSVAEQVEVEKYIELYNVNSFWDGETNKFSEESSVGQIFISDNQDLDLKQSCKLELNTGEISGKSIYDSSGNSNKGLLIGDYKVKKVRKGEPLRRDSFIKIPKKANNNSGAL